MGEKRVLIADSELETRQQLAWAVDKTPGLTVLAQTGDGGEVLTLGPQCDILVMDLLLPNVDGLEVLDRIRAWPRKPIVLVLTSFVTEQIAQLCMARGADYLMLKPCQADGVVNRMVQLAWASGDPEGELQERNLHQEVSAMLHEVGIPSHIKGYQYLREAIVMAVEQPQVLDGITKVLYPTLAREYGTTTCGVERAIRHAIEITWKREDLPALHQMFGATINHAKGKPTNSQFIAQMAELLPLQRSQAPGKQVDEGMNLETGNS